MKIQIVTLCVAGFVFAFVNQVEAQIVVLNTRNDAVLGGLSFRAGDSVIYDITTDEAEIFFSQDNFDVFGNNAINPDAIDVHSDGSFTFSPRGNLVLDGVHYDQRSVVRYAPATQQAQLVFRDPTVDVSGVFTTADGNLLLAAKSDEIIGGQVYSVGDVVKYDFDTGTSSLFFSAENFFTADEGGLFSAPANIDALHLLDNGNLLSSTTNTTEIGTSADDAVRLFQGGVYEYDFNTSEVTTFLDPSVFSRGVDVKSISVISLTSPRTVPEPSSVVLSLIGLMFFGSLRRRQLS